MTDFLPDDIYLDNEASIELYRSIAALPVLDWHSHVSAKELYENEQPHDISELWLASDHYKWRLMRSAGKPEALITGDAPASAKFRAFAETLPLAVGNPVYIWSHMELRRFFMVNEPLSPDNADAVWDEANSRIVSGGFSPRELLSRSNVSVLATCDDPADALTYHRLLRDDPSFHTAVVPGFRPQAIFDIYHADAWNASVSALCERADVDITDFSSLMDALSLRMKEFDALGCFSCDLSLWPLPFCPVDAGVLDRAVKKSLSLEPLSRMETDGFRAAMLLSLAALCSSRDWALFLHIGPIRGANAHMSRLCGPDTGFDSMGDGAIARPLCDLLSALEDEGALPKTVLFGLNPAFMPVLASAADSFSGNAFPARVQVGAPWWMNDNEGGIRSHIRSMCETGLIGASIGMASDSRSLLSFVRHDVYRRLLCSELAGYAVRGLYPALQLEAVARGIVKGNAEAYFDKKRQHK